MSLVQRVRRGGGMNFLEAFAFETEWIAMHRKF